MPDRSNTVIIMMRDELVEARASAILGSAPATAEYTGHFETQMRAIRFRIPMYRCLAALLRSLHRPDKTFIAALLISCALLCCIGLALTPVMFPGTGR